MSATDSYPSHHTQSRMYTTLISAAQLQALVTQATPLHVWDCSFDLMNPAAGPEAFVLAHIAGAQYVHLDTDLSDKSGATDVASGGRHPLPSRAKPRLLNRLASPGRRASASVLSRIAPSKSRFADRALPRRRSASARVGRIASAAV